MVLFLSAPNLLADVASEMILDTTPKTPLFLNIGPEIRHMRGDLGHKTKSYIAYIPSTEVSRRTYNIDNIFVGLNVRFGSFSEGSVYHEDNIFALAYLQGFNSKGEKIKDQFRWMETGDQLDMFSADTSLRTGKMFEASFYHNFWVGDSMAFNVGLGWDYKQHHIQGKNCTYIYSSGGAVLGTWQCPVGWKYASLKYDAEVPYVSAGMYALMGANNGVSLDIKGMYSNWASVYYTAFDYLVEYDIILPDNYDIRYEGKGMGNVLRGTVQLNVNATERLVFTVGGEYSRMHGGGPAKRDMILNNFWWGGRVRTRTWFDSEYYYTMFRISYLLY